MMHFQPNINININIEINCSTTLAFISIL